MPERKFQPGFRLSALDVVILVTGGVASTWTMTFDKWYGVAIAFVVLHFFLFCNVLRMSRPLELIWAVIFVALVSATISDSVLSWPDVFALSLAVTAVVAIIESKRPSYHGVGWRKLNPQLSTWWEATVSDSDARR